MCDKFERTVCMNPIGNMTSCGTDLNKISEACKNKSFSPSAKMICSISGQDTAISSYKRMLKHLEKEIQECTPEKYESMEEYYKAQDRLLERYENIQRQLNEMDTSYTEVNTDATNKTIGAVGGFFKDIGTALKTAGKEIIQFAAGCFGLKPAA